ncbi:MAG: Uma2 family endonuclease, partial [Deltaproteobacteria bacterium]|nr:Uma2 family endonuclease [Deltaproteobacteria bacterium]
TREQDQGRKKQIYERVLRVPEYFLFDPWSGELQGYRLTSGSYHEVVPDGSGRLASAALGLQLGVWHGCYDGVAAAWLRWHDADGRLLPTAGELAESAAAQAEQAEARAEQAEARAEQAEARAVREAEARTRAEARVEGLARHLAELTGKPLP